MLDKDALIVGLLIGLAIPFVGYATIQMIFEQIANLEFLNPETRTVYFRERTIAILAVCLNLIPFQLFKKRRFEKTMQGILIATFIYVFIWIYYFANLMLFN